MKNLRWLLPLKLNHLLLCFLSAVGLCGCKSVDVADAKTPPILLREAQSRTSRGLNTISFPAGVYVADFKTKDGIYFRAPTKIVARALGMNSIRRGGLFVPFADDGEHLIDNESAKWVHGAEQLDRHGAIQMTRNLNAPSAEKTDRRHAAWFDHQEGSGGLLVYGLTSPKNLFRLNEPIVFEIQKPAEQTNSH